MPAITYQDFSGGLDRRLPIGVQDAGKLWTLRNAYVTVGKRLKKRPALRAVCTGLTGSYGLEPISGRLKVFKDTGSTFVAPAQVDAITLDVPATATGYVIDRIHSASLFSGYPYVVARYTNGVTAHHYVDGGTTPVTDVNCPQTKSITKAASRLFAISGENVRYCAAGNPRDWTTASDAGFLPAGLQQDTKSSATAVGTFQDALVVFFSESAQIWYVATDPSANALSKRISGVGCQASLSLAGFANDLMFLSPYGFRSMTVQAVNSRIDDTDVGVPVDTLVTPDVASVAAETDPEEIFSAWIPQLGQYWSVFQFNGVSKAWAYTYSKGTKLACWSEYTFAVHIKNIATLDGKIYVRTEDVLYEVTADAHTDNGTLIDVEIQMAFQDAKSPGVQKQVYGSDYVIEGSPDVSFKYDPRDLGKESISQQISGDTRPGDMVPVEICAPAIAPVFRHSRDEAFELSAATFYYNLLGTV